MIDGCCEKNPTDSRVPLFPQCFVCGSENPIGLKTKFSLCDQGVEAVFTPDETHRGYENVVHGGIISALLDEAVIWAVYASTNQFGVTAELNIRLMKPLSIGETCTVKGVMIEDRGKLRIVEATIVNKEGELLARAEAKVFPSQSKNSNENKNKNV